MKLAVVSCDPPEPDGTSAGRSLYAWCEGMRALGHEVTGWSWRCEPPGKQMAPWCEWQPIDPGAMWQAHLKGIFTPRSDTARRAWPIPDDAIAVADDVPSFAAVARAPKSVSTIHYRALADAWSLRSLQLPQIQTARAERRSARDASLALAYSPRVARHLGATARFVPIACPVPGEALGGVDAPVACLLADWSWRPNLRALDQLLGAWPEVRHAVPAARLLLGGRNLDRAGIGTVAGVEIVGEVATSADILARASVVAFPCPPTSGPKTKVLEALAFGLPVVTTPPGAEGVLAGPEEGVVAVEPRLFAGALAAMLSSPERRARLGAAGREAVADRHSPLAVARARCELFERHLAAS